ncbi:MAG: lysophospholipid acyltransferase family protein [Fibrobacter sp.]|nr:lysophospholipid acyltransferase family protein [Fibrobacter sp.]
MKFLSRTLRDICAFAFRKASFALLYTVGWKRKVVQANRALTKSGDSVDSKRFYRQMLKNLTHHAADIIFRFRDFKKLPQDTAKYPFQSSPRGTTYALAEGSETVLQKMRQGGIFLTAHYGNYEAIGPWLCRLGIPLKASYIPLKPAWLNRLVENRMRAVDGKSYAVSARTPREFLRILDEQQLFCLLSDQDSRITSAEKGTFLEQIVNVNPLPDFLHRHRPDAPLYICWMEEQPSRKILHAEEILVAPGEKVMYTFNRWLEERIAENPALWYGWTHRRFYSCRPDIY